jgi:NAD(P)-dependent dehydrogenase (short-subunit alcohol dehydrogenase family)
MVSSLFDLTGKTALITGSTKGIGREIAEAFVDHGAQIAVCSRKLADAQAAAAEINARVGRDAAFGLSADLMDRASLIAAHDAAVARMGRIDVLVCNAAQTPEDYCSMLDYPADGYSKLMEGNIVNNAALMSHAARPMKERKDGVILATSSGGGVHPSYSTVPYGASKAGLNFLVAGLAAELAPFNVRVNAIAPGLTRSWSMEQTMQHNPAAMDVFVSRVPMRRVIEGREIAAGMVFLASEGGKAITGETILMTAGTAGNGAPPDA